VKRVVMEKLKERLDYMYDDAYCIVDFMKEFMELAKTEPEKVEEFFRYFEEKKKREEYMLMKGREERNKRKEEEMRYECEHPEDPKVIEKKEREKRRSEFLAENEGAFRMSCMNGGKKMEEFLLKG
jgi:rubrerythrin